jgi:hypothetical protein
MDFTVKKYKQLIGELRNSGYSFQTFQEFIENPLQKVVVLRHDVDKKPYNSLRFAVIQKDLGIRGTYYFRIVPCSFDKNMIEKISEMGHEIGYHYETMDTCHGKIEPAYEEFCKNLKTFREIVSVETVCMHGSPLSKFDNRAIWEKYSYKKIGITAEPYFDIDFNQVFYITDTGRRFDGDKVSIRDKPIGEIIHDWPSFHSTNDIIKALKDRLFPDVVLITLHPQRWSDSPLSWFKELIWQNCKNSIKKVIVNKTNGK